MTTGQQIIIAGPRSYHLVGPAVVIVEDLETAWEGAREHVQVRPDFGWMMGRYVAADTFNENGHFFPLADLETHHKLIPHTPVNMFHRAYHNVGTYVAASLEPAVDAYGRRKKKPQLEAAAAAEFAGANVETLSVFWRYKFPDEWHDVRAAHDAGLAWQCVDDETEVLTAAGWKSHRALVDGEDILTLNPDTHLAQWQPLRKVFRYDVTDVEMLELTSQTHSSLTTLNHRWLVRYRRPSRQADRWEWRESATLNQHTRIPTAAPRMDAPTVAKYEDAFVELVAWLWTEGTVKPTGGVTIYQSHAVNPHNCARIRAALLATFGPERSGRTDGLWSERRITWPHGLNGRASEGMSYFELRAAAGRQLLDVAPNRIPTPEFLCALTESQLAVFIDTAIKGDGSVAAADGQTSLAQKDRRLIDMLQMACSLAGLATNVLRTSKGLWRLCIVRRGKGFVNPLHAAQSGHLSDRRAVTGRVRYSGTVWCPNTENGTFLARRRGTVFFTGNSMECVPSHLTCQTGDCNQTFEYAGTVSPTYCEHMRENLRARKIMHNPHFVGGANVIPPFKPGWKQADISEMARECLTAMDAEWLYDAVAAAAPQLDDGGWSSIMQMLQTVVVPDLGVGGSRYTAAVERAKVEKDSVNFRESETPGVQCGTCIHNQGDGSCELVAGPIGDEDVCDLWHGDQSTLDRRPLRFGADIDGGTKAPPPAGATGVIVAVVPDENVRTQLAGFGTETVDELHVTLVFLGKLDADGALVGPHDFTSVFAAVAAFAAGAPPVADAKIGGIGRFAIPDGEATYASIDAPGLSVLRARLVAALAAASISISTDHDFTPHLTLAYHQPGAGPTQMPPALAWTIDEIELWWGDTHIGFPLADGQVPFLATATLIDELEVPELARQYSAQQREELHRQGKTMPDRSYPVDNLDDLGNAIQSYGRAPDAKRAALKRYLMRRARALGAGADVIDRIKNLGG